MRTIRRNEDKLNEATLANILTGKKASKNIRDPQSLVAMCTQKGLTEQHTAGRKEKV